MKTLFVSLVVFVFAFFIGCENTITDPVVTDQNSSAVEQTDAYKNVVSTWPGFIRLHQSVYDPSHPAFQNVLLNGVIKYKLETTQIYGNARYLAIKVNFYINAEIRHNCPRQESTPSVTAFANETVNVEVNTDEPYYIEKIFIVKNTCCGQLKLTLKFSVERDKLTLTSATLSPFGGWQPITYGI